jgi:hypothetical protein
MATRNDRTGEVGPTKVANIAPPLRTQDTSESSAPRRVSTQKAKVEETTPVAEEYAYDPSDIADDTEDDIVEYKPSDRIPAGEIIYIRNNTQGLVRWADGYKSDGTFNIKLDPAGQPGSIVSIETFGVLRNPGFQRWWKEGKLTVTNDPRIAPRAYDRSQVEVERLQYLLNNATSAYTAPGSLPLPKDLDMDFLNWYNKKSPEYKG